MYMYTHMDMYIYIYLYIYTNEFVRYLKSLLNQLINICTQLLLGFEALN